MCLLCLDIECSKNNCKNIRCKRYFLPFIFSPVSALHPEIFNFYYFPVVVGFAAFILFWNFPKIVYYTASRPLYYEDLFIDEKKLPNYDVDEKLKKKFQCILEWMLIITNTLLVAGLSDWWLYKTDDKFTLLEVLGVTGGIIKIFQTINNTISRIMLKILRKRIKKENRMIVEMKMRESKEESTENNIELPKFIAKRQRFDTI